MTMIYSLVTPLIGNYHLNGAQLELLDDFQDLGIQIDSKLKFYKYADFK